MKALDVDLRVRIGSLELTSPVMPASGTFEEGLEQVIDFNKLGALVLKTFTRECRDGNPLPRVVERTSGMINAIGIPSKGLENFLTYTLPRYSRYKPPLVVSISAETATDFAALAKDVSVKGVKAIEANISCPNIEANGRAFAMSATDTEKVVSGLRKATDLPLWVKLTPNTGIMPDVAKAAQNAGADACIISNTILAMAIDINSFKPSLGNVMGGYSGPAIKPIILRHVYQCSKVIDIPIIGCGGVTNADDVVEYMLAGASAVQVGTATFLQPAAMTGIIDKLGEFCASKGIRKVSELTGAVKD